MEFTKPIPMESLAQETKSPEKEGEGKTLRSGLSNDNGIERFRLVESRPYRLPDKPSDVRQ